MKLHLLLLLLIVFVGTVWFNHLDNEEYVQIHETAPIHEDDNVPTVTREYVEIPNSVLSEAPVIKSANITISSSSSLFTFTRSRSSKSWTKTTPSISSSSSHSLVSLSASSSVSSSASKPSFCSRTGTGSRTQARQDYCKSF